MTTFVSLTAPGGWTCNTPAVGAGGTVTCTIPTFPVGNATFTLVVRVNPNLVPPATLQNTATIDATTADQPASGQAEREFTEVAGLECPFTVHSDAGRAGSGITAVRDRSDGRACRRFAIRLRVLATAA